MAGRLCALPAVAAGIFAVHKASAAGNLSGRQPLFAPSANTKNCTIFSIRYFAFNCYYQL
jgi:hypothetical protein